MKFIFLNRDTGTGGLQTAILRMCRWLANNGHKCVVLTANHGNLTPTLAQCASIIRISYSEYFGLTTSRQLCNTVAGADCVHTFSWDTLILGIKIASELNTALIVGVYHPRAFNFFPIAPRPYYAELHRELFRSLADCNLLFMNESTRSTNQIDFNRAFAGSLLRPVPVEIPAMPRIPRKREGAFRLLSVGRLVNFKRYPIGVCELLGGKKWNNKKLHFSIYGDGPHKADLHEIIQRTRITDQVMMGGEVPYKELASVMQQHDAFIGMGTSALEAAVSGLPTIVAPAYGDGRMVSGFFHEQSGYNYGESAGDRSTEAMLDELLAMNNEDLSALGEREYSAAMRFGADAVMPAYLAHVVGVKAGAQTLPRVTKAQIARSIASGFITTRTPVLMEYWRKRNWHHPAQDK